MAGAKNLKAGRAQGSLQQVKVILGQDQRAGGGGVSGRTKSRAGMGPQLKCSGDGWTENSFGLSLHIKCFICSQH